MADTLRERLMAAKLTGHTFTASAGRLSAAIHSDADATELALQAVVTWLREEADQRRSFAYNNAGNDYLLDEAVVVESLADAIAAEEADRG